jgi:Zn finger protein HypA/HybF involved in hydrogenase expression
MPTLSEVEGAVKCAVCGWAEQIETALPRTEGDECPRCHRPGTEIVFDQVELTTLGLAWCPACKSWHSH